MLKDIDKNFIQDIHNLVTLNYSAFVLDKKTGNYNIKINFYKGECVNLKEFSEKSLVKKDILK